MRQDEFYEEVTCMDDVSSFCYDYDLESFMDDFCSSDSDWFVDDVYETIRDWDGSWSNLADFIYAMDDMRNSYSWLERDYDYGEWRGIDDDRFDEIRDELYRTAIENDVFDDGDNDNGYVHFPIEDPVEEPVDEVFEDEDFTVTELFSYSITEYDRMNVQILDENEQEETENAEEKQPIEEEQTTNDFVDELIDGISNECVEDLSVMYAYL